MPTDLFTHPFSAENLLEVSPLKEEGSTSWHGFQLDTSARSNYFLLADTKHTLLNKLHPDVLKLSWEDENLPDLVGSVQESRPSSQTNEDNEAESADSIVDEDDVWALVDISRPRTENKLLTWDQFLNTSHPKNYVSYFSEAPLPAYDALLRQATSTDEHTLRYARPAAFLDAVYNVALGRNSVLFSWNESSSKFEKNLENFTLSGLSQEVCDEVLDWFARCGTTFRKLNTLQHKRQTPTVTALFGAVSSCLDALEQYQACLRTQNATLLSFRHHWTVPCDLLEALAMVAYAAFDELEEAKQLQKVALALEEAFQRYPCFHRILEAVADRVMTVPLRNLNSELGLQSGHEKLAPTTNLLYNIFSQRSVAMINECATNLTVLKDNDSKHSYLRISAMAPYDIPSIKTSFQWPALAKIQQSAEHYEKQIVGQKLHRRLDQWQDAISSRKPFVSAIKPAAPIDNVFQLDFAVFEEDISTETHRTDFLKDETLRAIKEPSLPEAYDLAPFQALEKSITPLLTVQNRLTSYSIIQTLFLEQNLLCHLDLLQRCLLLGDGMFAARLSRALFDPNQVSGEGPRHFGNMPGLRLHDRETWPPAGSELRLALMEVLTDSTSDVTLADVQESISFSIRELSDDELERCRHLDSIFALDFLRLSYKPPTTAIELVVNSECLVMYDDIFKQSLLLLRMRAVAQSLLFDKVRRQCVTRARGGDHRFRLDIFRLVSAVVHYSHSVAVSVPWQKLIKHVQKVQHQLEQEDYEGTMSLVGSVSQLREQHEAALNEIMDALFLSKKQADAKRELDGIFTTVLEFSSVCNTNATGLNKEITKLSQKFNSGARKFLGHLRSVAGKQQNQDDALTDHLMIRLDMSDYYEKLP